MRPAWLSSAGNAVCNGPELASVVDCFCYGGGRAEPLMIHLGQRDHKLPSPLINHMVRDLPVFQLVPGESDLMMTEKLVTGEPPLIALSLAKSGLQGCTMGGRDDDPNLATHMQKVD